MYCIAPAVLWLDRGSTVLQGTIVAIENSQKLLYGLQYHPEVQHSERGIATLKRFLFGIAKMPADWKIENVLKEEMDKISATVSVLTTLASIYRIDICVFLPECSPNRLWKSPGMKLEEKFYSGHPNG